VCACVDRGSLDCDKLLLMVDGRSDIVRTAINSRHSTTARSTYSEREVRESCA